MARLAATTITAPRWPRGRTRSVSSVPYQFRPRGWDHLWILLFLAPFLLLYLGFTLWPLVATIAYSLYDWNGLKPLTDFVGLDNYAAVLQDDVFWLSFKNTLIFALGNTVIKLPLSLLAAVFLTRKWLWGKRFFRTAFFIPLVIPVSLAGLIFTHLLNPANGALNDFLVQTGLVQQPIDFIGRTDLAMASLIVVSIWQIFGQYMIYWIAALQNVPEDLYEAADIDGAGEWSKLIHITLPVIWPVAVVIAFLAFVNALRVFGLVVTMTGGGPGTQTYVVSYFIYHSAFSGVPFRYGYASAAAVFFGVATLVAMTVQGYFVNRAQAKRKEYGV